MAENEQKKLSGWRSLAAPGQEITVLLDIGGEAPYKYTFVPVIKNEDGTTELNQDAIYNIVEVYGADANAVINGYRSNPNQPISTKHSKGDAVQTAPQTTTTAQEQPKTVSVNPETTASGQVNRVIPAKAEEDKTEDNYLESHPNFGKRRSLSPQVESSTDHISRHVANMPLAGRPKSKSVNSDTTASGQVNKVEPAKSGQTTATAQGQPKPVSANSDTTASGQAQQVDEEPELYPEQQSILDLVRREIERTTPIAPKVTTLPSEDAIRKYGTGDTTASGQVNRVVPAKGDTVQTTPQTTTIPQERPKSGSANPDTTASGQVNKVEPAKAKEDKTEVESKPTEQSAGGGTTTNPVTTTAGEGAGAVEKSGTTTNPVTTTVGAGEPKTTEQEPDERLGLVGQVGTTPVGLNNIASVGQANVPTQPENSLAELYKMFNPEPPQRTPEEQAQFEKQRKASRIILGVADAINGLSNLGATIYGAPSREVVSMASKWSDAINAAEKQRKETHRIWREGLAKYTLEDIRHARETAQRKADREAQLKDNKELAKYRAELDKSAREHAAEIKTAQDKAANEEWDRRAEVQQENELEQIKARGKQSQIEAGIRAAASAGNAAAKADAKRPTFAVTISGTPVDVTLRNESDYAALFDLIKAEVEKSGDAESRAEVEAVLLRQAEDDGDPIKSAAHKKGYVMENFAKYYDQIKNNPMFKHLSIEFRDGAGNAVEFKPAEQKPAEPAPDITERINATQKAIKENNTARKNKDKVKSVGMATEGPLMSSAVVPTYVSGGVEKIQWYNE